MMPMHLAAVAYVAVEPSPVVEIELTGCRTSNSLTMLGTMRVAESGSIAVYVAMNSCNASSDGPWIDADLINEITSGSISFSMEALADVSGDWSMDVNTLRAYGRLAISDGDINTRKTGTIVVAAFSGNLSPSLEQKVSMLKHATLDEQT